MNTALKSQNPKDRILDTATRLFYEQGYLATGINQIIAEAKVAKASFYQHFPSKEALAVKYLEAYNSSFFKQLDYITQQSIEPKNKILALFDHLNDFSQQAECRGCAFLNIAVEFSDPQSQPRILIARFKKDLKLYIERLVREALSSNLGSELIQTKANAVYLLFEAALIESRVDRSTDPIWESKAAVELLLN